MKSSVLPKSRKRDSHLLQFELEARIRLIALRWVAAITGTLVIGGLSAFYFAPDRWHDIWLVISPLISLGVGAIAFCCGRRREDCGE